MTEYLDRILFSLFGQTISIGQMILLTLLGVVIVVASWVVVYRLMPDFFRKQEVSERDAVRLKRRIFLTLFFTLLFGTQVITGIDFEIYRNTRINIQASKLLIALWFFLLARLADGVLLQILLANYAEQHRREQEGPRPVQIMDSHGPKKVKRSVRWVVYLLALTLVISTFDINFTILERTIGSATFILKLSNVISVLLVLLIAQISIWILTNVVLHQAFQRRDLNIGSRFAISQLIRYVIYFVALLFMLNMVGVNITLIASGAAALLLGVGLGLQQTFNDFFSGILLLFERSVEVGDVVEIEGLVGKVRRIGLRTSIVQTRDNRSVIVPNSQLVNNSVYNWSHDDEIARFYVAVGVAYGSDTALVKKLLLQVAQHHKGILDYPPPFVRFVDFGSSSLDFELLFWSAELMRIKDVESDLRFAIDAAFREHHIAIPFPQRDLWIRNAVTLDPHYREASPENSMEE
ncbi:MAG: mechanosensitive ion channel [Lewinellaceae bacterium]|nr:mechanosensitive ion channel [Lewinellaceae bacterium]